MKKGIVMLVVLCLSMGGVAQAMDLKTLLLGGPPKASKQASLEAEVYDPVSLLIGIGALPDFDSKDNELNIPFGFRYNLFEIGGKVYLWPNGDDHTAWAVYVLRHLTYEKILIGSPFVGFETTVAGKTGDMYAFIAGMDNEIQKDIIMRTSAGFRTFDEALAASHDKAHDEIVAKLEFLFKF